MPIFFIFHLTWTSALPVMSGTSWESKVTENCSRPTLLAFTFTDNFQSDLAGTSLKYKNISQCYYLPLMHVCIWQSLTWFFPHTVMSIREYLSYTSIVWLYCIIKHWCWDQNKWMTITNKTWEKLKPLSHLQSSEFLLLGYFLHFFKSCSPQVKNTLCHGDW